MRPLELRISGFRSFPPSGAGFDFRRRRLLAVVGPIGSGKTTVLDAISFALYGRTPRIGRETRSLVHQRSDGCLVSLRFAVGEQVWQAERALRRNGQSQHKLLRLDEDSPGAEVLETVTQAKAVAGRVEEILGMDFDTFQRTVLLAQGQFARFLEMGPTERDTLLKAILGYERVDRLRAAAKDRAARLGAELAAAEARLELVEEAKGALESVSAAAEAVRTRKDRLEGLGGEVAALQSSVASAAEDVRSADARNQALADVAGRLPPRRDVARLAERLTAADAEEAAAAARLAEARSAVEVGERRAAEVDTLRATVQRAGELLAKYEPLAAAASKAAAAEAEASDAAEKARRRLAVAEETAAAAADEAAAADGALATARRALDEARHRQADAERADMAGALAGELVSGEPCPVCGRVVTAIPQTVSSGDAAAARRAVADASIALERAEAVRTRAGDAATQARAAVAAAREAAASAESRRATAAADLDAARDAAAHVAAELGALLGAGDPGELVEGLAASIRQADADLEDARSAEKAARQAVELAGTERRSLDAEMAAMAARVAAASAQLGLDIPAPTGAEAMLAAAAALHEGWESRRKEAEESLEESRRRVASAEDALADVLKQHGIAETYDRAIARVEQQLDDLTRRVAELDSRVAVEADLTAERAAVAERRRHFDTLAAELVDSRFVAFLLQADRTALIEVAAAHFDRLSSGRYRFEGDRDLTIVDATAPDSLRSPDSLSGGESFLAALALALALADMVTREGATRDAFLLDEGFGTLDAEYLDLAMDGIESLVDEEGRRLVVVVSHRPEVRERIGDAIVLDKDPVTGDTVVRRA